jgi:hypothetical protein
MWVATGGGQVVSLLQELEEVGQERDACRGELELYQGSANRAETQLAAGGSSQREGP